ncbi:major facilitator superfamily transporter [Colletotrichum paranaense]|uniref:Major facilitator superfamily transporter n=5 Tax=Colletotrichum acutatum species complex TaxID=2707335 RepID=A0A135SNK9_9PEZI|nr:major facilitator superfamily transporter [Colletotrichum paranaense]XP_060378653.1 major facilitator superfamily transporter [Colletotrichum tamarilloi]KAI3541341.1 major facilitator superfamily transporter [Colletotrichum filicis]KAK0372914.1 major facilitator superfamily transporter [Colletotrichum limetticola]KAK1467142.1 major facilitator superfamily transporter [Colletotrichum melonis]KXH37441.1 major facilitator superfamily transporter [Colletotrichum simmondsii]KAK1490410.1 major f
MPDWKAMFAPAPSLDVPGLETVDLADKEMERRIVRKQDLRILPWICITYLLNYLDRVNLGNARTLNNDKPEDNIVTMLNLTGQRYNVAVALFFVPYVLMEFPSNIMLKYFSPSKWISRIMVSWGIVTICTAACTTYGGLLAVRIMLGLAEAGFFPGIMMYLCFWYKPEERATRMAIFASSVAVAGAFGGLLATGISFLNRKGGLTGWQWLFILEGIPAVIVGVMVWFMLPDYPQTAAWLTPEERAFAVKRLGPFAPSMSDKHWDSKVAKKTIIDPYFWLFAIMYFLMTNSLNAFGYFAPTIVSSLGFKGYNAQLLTVPPNVFAMFIIIGNCLHSDRTKERSRHVIGALIFVATGYLLLAIVKHWGVRYFAVCIIACTNAAVLPFVAHRTATVQGSTATALATGGMIAIANTGGISAPFLFPSTDSPMYSMGNWTIFAFLATTAILTGYVWYVFGSHSGYRTGTKDAAGNLEVLDAGAGDPDELMNKKMGIVTDQDKKDEEA